MSNIAKKVVAVDNDGNDAHIFDNAKIAANHFSSNYPNSIFRSIRYGVKAFGYRWKYLGEELISPPIPKKGRKTGVIARKEETGEELSYSSLSEASRCLRIGLSAIESALLTGNKSKGYRFRYQGEEVRVPAKKRPMKLEVVALNDNREVAMRFSSVTSAAEHFHVVPSAIYRCLRKGSEDRRCKGYYWRYGKKG